jgi:hypothetical protein
MIVTVGGNPAVCHNLTCDFTYTLPEGEITSFTFVESTKKLTIVGTALPTVIDSVEFALARCNVDTATDTLVECVLEKEPTCGDYKPILTSMLGIIPVASGVNAHTVQCTITAAQPNTGLNLLGGDNITLSGSNLPHTLETSIVSIKFSDA